MLQYDKRSATAKNGTKNFLAINKNLSKNKPSHLSKANQKKQEENQRKNKFQQGRGARDKVKPHSTARPPSGVRNKPHTVKPKENEETVTISKDYLEKLLQGSLQAPQPAPMGIHQPVVSHYQPTVPVVSQYNTTNGVYDHNQVPGLNNTPPSQVYTTTESGGQSFPTSTHFSQANTTSPYSPSMDVLKSSFESPRGSGGTYHRGTTNRPLHPAMKSQIVFGGGPGWSDMKDERNEANRQWASELGEQMKAHNVCNPTSVSGRGGDTQIISVGLSLQSPREMNEKKMKELEHREFLLAQIEEKKRKKDEERLLIEQEAAKEERRLALERERLARDFEMEKELQRRKKMEEANRLAHLQQRIKMAELSALNAKEDMKKNRRQVPPTTSSSHHSSYTASNTKRVAFNNSQHYSRSTTEPEVPPLYTGGDNYFEGVSTSLDIRSPSLHTIPISASQSDKSITSPRNIRNSYEKPHGSRNNARSQKVTGMPPSNSQVSLYSSSSEEPVNAAAIKRKPKPKPEHPGSGGKKAVGGQQGSGAGNVRESRIPRKSILRKQLGRNLHNKSESESEGRKPSGIPIAVHRKSNVASNYQAPNSVAKQSNKVGVRSASHKGPRYNRPSSNESQDDVRRPPPRARLTKAHSVPEEKVQDPSPPPTVFRSTSPPVPAVARRLAEEKAAKLATAGNKEEDNLPPKEVKTTHETTVLPDISVSLYDNPTSGQSQKMKRQSPPKQDFELPELVPSHSSKPRKKSATTKRPSSKHNGPSPPLQQPPSALPPLPDTSNKLPSDSAISYQPHINQPSSVQVKAQQTLPPINNDPIITQPKHQPLPPLSSSSTGMMTQAPEYSQTLQQIPIHSTAPQQASEYSQAPQHHQPLPPINNRPLPLSAMESSSYIQQQYFVYSQSGIPSFDCNQSTINDPPNFHIITDHHATMDTSMAPAPLPLPPEQHTIQYVRAPSYPPVDDQPSLPTVTNKRNRNDNKRRGQLMNGVCTLPTIQEVRSKEEMVMKESLSNNNLPKLDTYPGGQQELYAQLLKLRQGIMSQRQTVHSRIAGSSKPQHKRQ